MVRHNSRWTRWLCLAIALGANSLQAQTSRRLPREVGQILNAALRAVIPPEMRLTDGTVAERGIRLDYGLTMAAFGLADDADTRTGLGLDRAVTQGSTALLEDCDQQGGKACRRLGRSVYVYLEPVSVSSAEAVVWVHVVWATTPSTRTYRSSSSTEVILARSGAGPWKFVRTRRGVIS